MEPATVSPPASMRTAESPTLLQRLPRADHVPGSGGVVGDDVGVGEAEVAVARVDDLHRGSDGVDAGFDVDGRIVEIDVLRQTVRDSRVRSWDG